MAIAAVSTLSLLLPSPTRLAPLEVNSSSSFNEKSPSGPMMISPYLMSLQMLQGVGLLRPAPNQLANTPVLRSAYVAAKKDQLYHAACTSALIPKCQADYRQTHTVCV